MSGQFSWLRLLWETPWQVYAGLGAVRTIITSVTYLAQDNTGPLRYGQVLPDLWALLGIALSLGVFVVARHPAARYILPFNAVHIIVSSALLYVGGGWTEHLSNLLITLTLFVLAFWLAGGNRANAPEGEP